MGLLAFSYYFSPTYFESEANFVRFLLVLVDTHLLFAAARHLVLILHSQRHQPTDTSLQTHSAIMTSMPQKVGVHSLSVITDF